MLLGMSTTQIAVRLDDKYVAFLDEQVKAGKARSRAEIVESALERELRRRLDEEDLRILLAHRDEPDELDEWVSVAAATADLSDLD
jgi:Arc/MetJ-type ribon-helix-helix transcriptional regulator